MTSIINRPSVIALYDRVIRERENVVAAAAASNVLPPAKLLSYLTSLDGAAMAIEAVLTNDRNSAADSQTSPLAAE